jgi:ADP-heptose:LPS heptosyltransferase
MKFLIIQTAFIGDVVLATPLVEKLRRFYPDARIDFLLRKGNEKLLAGHPYVEKVWIWDKKQRKYASLLALGRSIRSERYDWAINCQRFAASGLLTAFSGAKGTVGFAKNPFSPLFSRRIPHVFGTTEQPIHEVERNLALIEHLTDDSFERPRLYPSEADFRRAQALAGDTPYVCIAPTSVWFTKQFPAHKWVDLIQKTPNSRSVFLLGGPDDFAACEQILLAVARPQVQNLAGQLSFLESAALMQGAVLNYANDSAPLHFASAVNAPTVAVFCSTLPNFGFGPLAEQRWVVESRERIACRPCGLHGRAHCPEGHFKCAETVRVEDLLIG